MIVERMKRVLSEKFDIDTSSMDENTVFRNEGLGIDSMSFMEWLCFLEDEFDISIPDEAFTDTMTTLGDLAVYIQSQLDKK